MNVLMKINEISQARQAYATDWNSTTWILWWSFTALAALLYFGGLLLNSKVSYNSPLPYGLGLLMAGAGLIFSLVAVAMMMRHVSNWQDLGLIALIYFIFALAAGSVAGFTVSTSSTFPLGRTVLILIGGWTLYLVLAEAIERFASGLGISWLAGLAILGIGGFVIARNR